MLGYIVCIRVNRHFLIERVYQNSDKLCNQTSPAVLSLQGRALISVFELRQTSQSLFHLSPISRRFWKAVICMKTDSTDLFIISIEKRKVRYCNKLTI